jgi:hypothetical protein
MREMSELKLRPPKNNSERKNKSKHKNNFKDSVKQGETGRSKDRPLRKATAKLTETQRGHWKVADPNSNGKTQWAA